MRLRIGFRTRVFLAVFSAAAVALALAATVINVWLGQQTYSRIEHTLTAQARLVARILGGGLPSGSNPADETRQLGEELGVRITLVDENGSVVADSSVGPDALLTLDNHRDRPEIVAARAAGTGIARRYSHTLGHEMLYVAVPGGRPPVAIVRLAVPLTDIARQTGLVRRATVVVLCIALLAAFAMAWIASAMIARRLRAVADAASRYGGLSQGPAGRGDELDTVGRVLDDAVRALSDHVGRLARDRAQMGAILAGMAEGVVAVDGSGTIELANAAAREVLGLAESAIGRPFREAIQHGGVVDLITATLEGRQPAGLEFSPGPTPDRRVVARATAITGNVAPGVVLVLHDISDLTRVDQVRRDFVANVSHELRTPLTAVRGYVEALRDEAADGAERQRFLEIIERHASRMERLVKDLLRLASLEGGQEAVEAARCDVSSLIGSVVSDLSALIESKDQQVEVTVDRDAASVMTDPSKLQDALRNIVENACNYAPAGSTIRIGATRDGSNRFRLSVADEGPGIPEADLTRVFERFYRVDKARSRESGGTGLGLSIVKHLVELLGGEVRAANRPEGGAVFTITLPADPSPPAAG